MSFVTFIIFTVTMGALIIWGLLHEDMLIKIEDKIIEDIRDQIAENRRSKNIRVVKSEPQKTEMPKREVPRMESAKRENPIFTSYVA